MNEVNSNLEIRLGVVQKPYKYYLQFKPTSFTEQDYTKIADKLASDAIEQATIEVHV